MQQPARHYPFYSALWYGFFDKDFYVDVATRWRAGASGYLAMMVAVGILPLMVIFHFALQQFYTAEIPFMLRQMPDIMFYDGRARSDVEQPHTIRSTDGTSIIVIDTENQFATPDDAGTLILLHSDEVIVRKKSNETRSYSLDEIEGDTMLTPEMVNELAQWLHPWIIPVSFVTLWLLFGIGRIIQMLFYALIGLAIAAMLRIQMNFGALLQITMVIIGNVIAVTSLMYVVFGAATMWVTFPMAMFYLWFGIRAVRDWARSRQAGQDSGAGI
jgi:hypothetical protein